MIPQDSVHINHPRPWKQEVKYGPDTRSSNNHDVRIEILRVSIPPVHKYLFQNMLQSYQLLRTSCKQAKRNAEVLLEKHRPRLIDSPHSGTDTSPIHHSIITCNLTCDMQITRCPTPSHHLLQLLQHHMQNRHTLAA